MTCKKKFLIGYIGDDGLTNITKEDALKLTHLNVAFGHVIDNKVTVNLKNLNQFKKIREFNPNIKILISVGGWGAGGFSEAASTIDGRKIFSETALQIIKTYDFDGIDLDWEYPCYSEAGIKSSKDDKKNFTLLLKELRECLDSEGKKDDTHYMLTIAAGADEYYIDGTEMNEIQKYLDYIQLMTYDMRGGFQTLTGHHTNLYTSTGDLFRISCDKSAKIFINAGVPKEKLLLGVAFYSRMWKDVPNINNGLNQMCPSFGGYGPDYTTLVKDYINRNGFKRYWDDEAKAPYLFNGKEFITYDDGDSVKHKAQYVNDNGLAGLMFWVYGCDKTKTLINSMYDVLK